MDNLTKKSHTVSRGYTYSYYVSAPPEADSKAPALVFCHGWPDDATLWQFTAPHFTSKYRVVIPDGLGVGGSSKPLHLAAYNFSYMTRDYLELLDAENIETFIAIGHDWGAALAGRICLYAPLERVKGLVLVNIPYTPPNDHPFDVDIYNRMSKQAFGYETFAYWHFFSSDKAGELMGKYPEKVWAICHGAGNGWMRQMFGDRDAIRNFLLSDESTELKDYAQDPELRQHFIDRVQKDGMHTWQNWYKAMVENVQYEAERVEIPKERRTLNLPVLFIGCEFDACAPPATIEVARAAGVLPDLQVATISCGHWSPFEAPGEIVSAIEEFLQKKF